MRKQWMWSLGIVGCLVPILAAQEIYKEMVLAQGPVVVDGVGSECPQTEANAEDVEPLPNPKEVAEELEQTLAEQIKDFEKALITNDYYDVVNTAEELVPLLIVLKPETPTVESVVQKFLSASVKEFNARMRKKKYKHAKEVAARVINFMPTSPVAELMWNQIQAIEKQQKPVAQPKNWNQFAAQRKKAKPAPKQPVYVAVTYPVADLVISVPKKATLNISGKNDGLRPQPQPKADYASLIDLIQSTVEPDSWEHVGGQGFLRPYPNNLSLVVRQTPKVHEEIADLLEQLRRLQDIQVTLELRLVTVPETPTFWADTVKSVKTGLDGNVETQVLNDSQMRKLMQNLQTHARSNILFAPKVTLFNGQALEVKLGEEGTLKTLLTHSVVSADRRFVRLNAAVNAQKPEDVIASTISHQIADGNTLLINPHLTTTTETRTEAGVPILQKVPYVSRLFKNTGVRYTDQILILVTPRIIIHEEEEELLGLPISELPAPKAQKPSVLMVTPQGVIAEEEEPLLGLPKPQPATPPLMSIVTPRIIIQEEEEELLAIPIPEPVQDAPKKQSEILPVSGTRELPTELPEAKYLDEDVQYFPAGPEYKLADQIKALEEYKAAIAPVKPEAKPEEKAQKDVDFFLGIQR